MSRSDTRETGAALQFIDVSAARSGRLIWSQASFVVPAGGIVAVIGANGSGKTTLLHMILGLHPVASGQLRVFSQPPGADNAIGYVPQDYLSGAGEAIRAVDVVRLGLTGHRWGLHRATPAQRNLVRDNLNAVDAAGFANARLAALSGGQRQRVAIAEALVSSPRMLILDEPLAALDLRSQREVVLLLAQLHAEIGMTTVVVAHDLNPLLPIVDSAVYLLDGTVSHALIDEILDEALLSEMYGVPIRLTLAPDGHPFIRSAL